MKKLFLVSIFALMFGVNSAFAHERQVITVGGVDYLFVIGSLNEPIIVGDKSGIDLKVFLADPKDIGNSSATNTKPVMGLEKTLRVENILGSSKKEFPLSASWGKPGNYQTVFYPMSAKQFSYRVFGTIGEKNIDVIFICNQAGHVMNEMGGGAMQMKNGDFPVKFHSGTFGCPQEKEGYVFPTSSWKDVVKNNAFGIIAILMVLAFIAQNRKAKK